MDGRVDFTNICISRCRDELAAKSSLEDNGIFPVRVIDVRDTFDSKGGIAFAEPKDWNFHTVSHRWSMEIQQLCEEVCNTVREERNMEYNEVFKHKKLGNWPGYTHLLEFLMILQSDGVERVWLDTLCINQADDQEKSQEIVHMGAFYFYSLGCYVTAHGFGKGFGMTDDDHHFPPWFSRVWTFQEFILPKRLTFVVEMGRSDFHTTISLLRMKHLRGDCECKGEARSQVWLWGSDQARTDQIIDMGSTLAKASATPNSNPPLCSEWWTRDTRYHLSRAINEDEDTVKTFLSMAVESRDEDEFWRVLESSVGYNRCMRGRFQRVKLMAGQEYDEEKGLYLLDRDTYIYILSHLKDESGKDELITEMLMRFWVVCGGGLPAVVREISLRSCSNEEDRVLSVLALLGLDGKLQQLRTGQTLNDQIVEMCNAMAKCNLANLITLCAAFLRPYTSHSTVLRLSWAPHFLAPPGNYLLEFVFEQTDFLHKSFHNAVSKASVSPSGLSLSCYILKGRLLPLFQHAKQCIKDAQSFNSKVGCYACLDLPESMLVLDIIHGHTLSLIASSSYTPLANTELVLTPASRVSSAPHYVASNYFEGAMMSDIETYGMRWGILPDSVEYNVWLLLLGTIERKLPFTNLNRLVLVFMVCVGESRESLHKIGIVQILPTYTEIDGRSIIHFDSFQNADCTIGEFSSKRDWKAWIKNQCLASRRWNFT